MQISNKCSQLFFFITLRITLMRNASLGGPSAANTQHAFQWLNGTQHFVLVVERRSMRKARFLDGVLGGAHHKKNSSSRGKKINFLYLTAMFASWNLSRFHPKLENFLFDFFFHIRLNEARFISSGSRFLNEYLNRDCFLNEGNTFQNVAFSYVV